MSLRSNNKRYTKFIIEKNWKFPKLFYNSNSYLRYIIGLIFIFEYTILPILKYPLILRNRIRWWEWKKREKKKIEKMFEFVFLLYSIEFQLNLAGCYVWMSTWYAVLSLWIMSRIPCCLLLNIQPCVFFICSSLSLMSLHCLSLYNIMNYCSIFPARSL